MLHYTLSLLAPTTHRYRVTMRVPEWGSDQARLHLPVWTPGSYLVREFARHIEGFRATALDGTPIPWQRSAKASWVVEGTAGGFCVHYEVYANDLTVRTSHLDSSHGYFNGSNLFLYAEGATHEPCTLAIESPPGWHCSIALPEAAPGRYLAKDYDTLADSPGEIGTHRRLFFDALGVPHEVALWGHGNEEEQRLLYDLKRIVEQVAAFFGGTLPYERYLFIMHLGDRIGGGLEHRDSTTLAVDRWSFRAGSEYQKVLRLAIHEYFHVWLVKRIRPHNLGPFDYSQESYTPLLWVMEGFTSYYDLILMSRIGFVTPARTLELLAERIQKYLEQPGRLVQSVEEASLLAWIKQYRPDENSPNSSISYYLKGSLVALLLDLRLRQRSDGTRSLDDLMRLLWERFGQKEVGFTPAQFEALLDEVAGEPLGAFLDRYVRGVEELPLAESFAALGIELVTRVSDTPWHGVELKSEAGRLLVKTVLRDSPAEAAGLMPNDTLLAMDGIELRDESFFRARLRERQAGDTIALHFFRAGLLHDASIRLAAPATDQTVLLVKPKDEAQRAILREWVGQP